MLHIFEVSDTLFENSRNLRLSFGQSTLRVFCSKYPDSVLVKVPGWFFWLKYPDSILVKVPKWYFVSVLVSDLVAHLHVTFCTINALLKHCVFIASSFKYLHRVLVKVPGWCFKDSTLIASRLVTW